VSRHVTFLCGLAAAFFMGRTAQAAVDLTWSAPAACPPGAEVRAAVGRLVGPSWTATSATALRVEGRVRKEDGGFRVVLDVGEGDGRSARSVVAPSCELATDAAVVVIAMLVPRVSGAPAAVTSDGAEPHRAAPAPPLPEPPDTTTVPRPVDRSIWAGLGGFVDTGVFRTMAPGVVGSVAWRAPRRYGFGAALGGSSTPERPIHLWHVSTRGELWLGETTALGAALGFDAGLLHGREADTLTFAVCVGPFVRRAIAERFALRGGLELVVPLAGPTGRLANDPEYAPKAIASRATISVEMGF
jgi:hypothetical protein